MKLTEILEFDFFPRAEKWLENIRATKAKQTYKNYKVAIETAMEYERVTGEVWDVYYLDRFFIEKYIRYLVYNMRLMSTAVDKYVKVIKYFVVDTYPEVNQVIFNQPQLKQSIVWLSSGELLTLRDVDLDPPFDITRDLFLFQASTGLRYFDTQRFNANWIDTKEECIVEYPQLTQNKSYFVMREVPETVLKAYGGTPPKMGKDTFINSLRTLLHSLDFRRPVQIFDNNGNRKEAPLALAVDETTGYQTYIMLLLLANGDVNTIMRYAGVPSYTIFRPYMDAAYRHIRDNSQAAPLTF